MQSVRDVMDRVYNRLHDVIPGTAHWGLAVTVIFANSDIPDERIIVRREVDMMGAWQAYAEYLRHDDVYAMTERMKNDKSADETFERMIDHDTYMEDDREVHVAPPFLECSAYTVKVWSATGEETASSRAAREHVRCMLSGHIEP
jgi:hypothetical protein